MSAMSRLSSQTLRSLLALGVLSAGAGCADNEVSVYIRAMKSPIVSGVTCTLPFDPTTPSLNEGVLDLAFKTTYHLAPLIQSNIYSRADMASNRTESAHIFIEGFIVEAHEDSPDGPLISGSGFTNPFTVYQSLTVIPGIGGQPGTGVAFLEALPTQIGQALYQEVCVTRGGITRPAGLDARCPVPLYNPRVSKRIILRVSAFGHTGGGIAVETPSYNFPVTACCGCLVQFPPATTAMASGMGMMGTTRVVPVCNPGVVVPGPATCPNITGQDFAVDCNFCSTSLPSLCQPFGFVPATAPATLTCN